MLHLEVIACYYSRMADPFSALCFIAMLISINHFGVTCERHLSVIFLTNFLMKITKSKGSLNIFLQTAIFFEHYFFYYDFLKFVRIYAAPSILPLLASFFL